ncbi:hypothetical protein H6F42_09475 [Pseudanabaena sp. FACHB-1998]|uniref:hypothetical protein n=1 Tax=Pseudanabaena sp. FACHB-1998 TaxID=2692858 RepID=UPI001680C3E0|nr:hypothetical protein [Pseudanabaena sp. FACHB-1998]MBD2177138.1 hypothetical protein [Pseudanabaena sp. FACHB-1998]
MKKIAFYVEGQTELFFLNKLLIEISGARNIILLLKKFNGKNQPPTIYPKSLSQAVNPSHTALIYNCGSDEGVKTRILEDYQDLINEGYLEVIGIRDLYPLHLTDLTGLENGLRNGVPNRKGQKPLPANASIIVAVHEVEAWFLSEYNHFSCIDPNLTQTLINSKSSILGFNPYVDDMTLRYEPHEDLKKIYQLVSKTYTKKKSHIERTVECLDYENVYINLNLRVAKLGDLISKIDSFLT